jgi:multiple sugar transport system substrate-binding protein
MDVEQKKISLSLSPYCEELFGKEMTEKLILDFNESNPGIVVKLFSFPDEKNRNPDILMFNESEYKDLMSTGALTALSSYIDYINSYQYAVPMVSFMDVLFYNIDLLSSAGFDRPPKTREEFILYAKTLSSRRNARRAYVSGAAISLNPDDKQALSRDIFSWIWAAGGDFFSEGNEPVLNAKTAAGDFTFLKTLYSEGAFATDIFETTGTQRLAEFSSGRVSMIIDSISVIPFLRERMGDDAFGITIIPSDTTSKYNISLSGIYTGISTQCKYSQEAWNFIEFLLKHNQFFSDTYKLVSSVTSDMFPDKYIAGDPFYSKARDIFESSEIVSSFSGNTNSTEYENVFMEEFKVYLTGNQPAQEVINSIQRRWNEISRM